MKILFPILWTLALIGCSRNEYVIDPVLEQSVYQYLPENLVASNDDGTILARYVDPTDRYDHGILGDKIEAGGLLVMKKKKSYYSRLDPDKVFEDLKPRMYDVDMDGEFEFVTIRSSLVSGASVCVYKIIGDELLPWLQTGYIGQTHRWLNIAAINDLDDDGSVEIAWVETPHIGGTLKIARIKDGMIRIIDTIPGVSNHRIGSRNLCLSTVALSEGVKTLFLPDDSHNAVVGFTFRNDRIHRADSISIEVDMSVPLHMQYSFGDLIPDVSCIYSPMF